MNLEKAIHRARFAAAEADSIMMKYYGKEFEIYKKPGARSKAESVLTEPDLKCDEFLRGYLTSHFPESSVVTEESVDLLEKNWADREWIWYVDPIDGSMSYMEGSDCFGVSIALCHKGEPVLGVITNPALELTAWAAKGSGAWLNDNRISFNNAAAAPRPVLSVGQNKSRSYALALSFLKPPELLLKRSVVTKALMVLKGDADYTFSLPWAVFHGGAPSVWDLAGGAAIFREAGGISTTCDGSDLMFNTHAYTWKHGHIFGHPDARNAVVPPLREAIERRRAMNR